jgi:hypothetical protein
MYKKVSKNLAVRLGYNPGLVNAYNALGQVVRLAHVPGAQGDNNLLGRNGVAQLDKRDVRLAATNAMLSDGGNNGVKYRYPHAKDRKDQEAPLLLPALLVSYYYLEPFLKNRHRYVYRDWAMDSGAFSAKNSGKEVNLQSYIDACKQLLAEDPTLVEIFALDVIGDWKASIKNCEEMWHQGIEAIPCWHQGEPWDVLVGIAKDYPKVALGGLVGTIAKQKRKTVEQAFARIWPKAIHGFGLCTEDLVLNFPFHSVDATNWEMGPCAFGRWNAFGKMSVRGSKQNLRAEVEWHLKLERDARRRWKREMDLLAQNGPILRLSHKQSGREKEKFQPTVRLGAQQSSDAQIKRSALK